MRTHRPYISLSPVTNELLKRKRALEDMGGTAEQWQALAEDFLADEGRANYSYCMNEFRKAGGEIGSPVAFDYVPEPETPDWMERKDLE